MGPSLRAAEAHPDCHQSELPGRARETGHIELASPLVSAAEDHQEAKHSLRGLQQRHRVCSPSSSPPNPHCPPHISKEPWCLNPCCCVKVRACGLELLETIW